MTSSWLILCGSLAMFMHAGFAMLEAGTCRAKNASNVLVKNLASLCVSTLGFYWTGYALAYGVRPDSTPQVSKGGNGFVGTAGWAGRGFNVDDLDGNVESTGHPLMWFFQWAFCSASITIVSGAVAERVLSPAYCIFAFVMSAFIYPVVVAWTWGYGWISTLFDVGVVDFAGSGVVHVTGGVAGLVGTLVLGARRGRFPAWRAQPGEFDPHSLPLVVLGTFILWFGWNGFNCGSTLEMNEEVGLLAAQVVMNTTISAATGGLTVFFLRFLIMGAYDVCGMCNGILAGLVSITAPCANVEAGSAFSIGLIGAFVYQAFSMLLVKLEVDDPLDAVPVHCFCGCWGILAAAVFDWGNGFDHFHGNSGFHCMTDGDGNCATGLFGKVIGAQIVMLLCIIGWSSLFSGVTFLLLKKTGTLRIDEYTEESGVDAAKHCPAKAYAIPAVEYVSPGKSVTLSASSSHSSKASSPDKDIATIEA